VIIDVAERGGRKTVQKTLMQTARAFFLALVAMFGPGTPAYACDCITPGSACSEFARVDAVFAGRVVSLEDRRVEFAVSEAFRGITGARVTLQQSGSNCDYRFDNGHDYFVYAYEGVDGQLTASICSRTGPLSRQREDLGYARRMAALPPGTRARLTGSIVRLQRHANGYKSSSVSFLPVVLEDGVRRFTASADRNGRFQFADVPFGRYEVRVDVPPGFAFNGHAPVNLWDPHGCEPLTLGIEYDGRIVGRLLNADGGHVGGAAVTLVRTTAANALPLIQTRTSIDGRFELQRVQPGSYFLRIDTTPGAGGFRFYRSNFPATPVVGQAVRVSVGAGTRVNVNDIELPNDITLLTMTGIAVDDQGRPAAGAEVSLVEHPGRILLAPSQRTDSNGRFIVAVVKGQRYAVLVNHHTTDARGRTRASFSAEVPFVGSPSSPPISVVLQRDAR
jgi:hypothetical protein